MHLSPILAYYDATKSTYVSADASSYGIEGMVKQDHGGGKNEAGGVLLKNVDPCRAMVRTNRT